MAGEEQPINDMKCCKCKLPMAATRFTLNGKPACEPCYHKELEPIMAQKKRKAPPCYYDVGGRGRPPRRVRNRWTTT